VISRVIGVATINVPALTVLRIRRIGKEQRDDDAAADECSGQIDVEHAAKISGAVLPGVRHGPEDPRVVDQEIDAVEALQDRARGRLNSPLVGRVDRKAQCAIAQ
jgi:hypothetical protein